MDDQKGDHSDPKRPLKKSSPKNRKDTAREPEAHNYDI